MERWVACDVKMAGLREAGARRVATAVFIVDMFVLGCFATVCSRAMLLDLIYLSACFI